jgi:hypothetical protein
MLSKGNPIQDNQHLNGLVVTLVKNQIIKTNIIIKTIF